MVAVGTILMRLRTEEIWLDWWTNTGFNGAYAQNRLYTLGIHWTQYNLDGGGNEVDEAEERWWVGPGPSEEIYSRGNTVIWTQGAHTK